MRFFLGGLVLMGTIGFVSPGGASGPRKVRSSQAAVPTYGYQVVRSFPHDREAFTQGLIFRNGFLYESTGLNGRSGIRKVKLETGEIVHTKPPGAQDFGAGITDWNR